MTRAATPLRYLAAALLLVGGLVHLDLYFHGYKDFHNANLGRSFLLNVIASVVVAIGVAVSRRLIVRLAGIALAAGTLIAFAIGRTNKGIFGLSESGLHPSPQALIALIAEIGAIVVLVVLIVIDRAPARERVEWRRAVPVAIGAVALTVILGVVWSQDNGKSAIAATASPSSVTISNFTFLPGELKVAPGTTVTWTNTDDTDHTVTADDGAFKSADLGQGATFQHTFTTAGTYSYICSIHHSMKATVVVG